MSLVALKDPPASRIESTVGLGPLVGGQIPRLAKHHMHPLSEVFPGLLIASAHFVGDQFRDQRPRPITESGVIGGECDG